MKSDFRTMRVEKVKNKGIKPHWTLKKPNVVKGLSKAALPNFVNRFLRRQ